MPRFSIYDPKIEAREVLLLKERPAQEGESLNKTCPFLIPVPPSSRRLKASGIYTGLMNPHNAFLRGRRGVYLTQVRSEYCTFS